MSEQEFPLPALRHEPSQGLICQECLREFSPDELESREDRGSTLLLCPGCRAALDERQALAKAAAEEEKRFHDEVVLALNRDASVPSITETVSMLLEKFGGRQGFIDTIYQQISAQLTDKKRMGSPAAMRTCKMLLNLVLASTAYQSTLPAAAELTDAQVQEELEKMLTKLKAKNGGAISNDNA